MSSSAASGCRRRRFWRISSRSEEHTSELQSPCNLVCRLLLEKKNIQQNILWVLSNNHSNMSPLTLTTTELIQIHMLHSTKPQVIYCFSNLLPMFTLKSVLCTS